ncbi:protein kinase [Acidobacteriota bacterium]
MICPKCRTENTQDSQFCKNCASSLDHSKKISHTRTLETPASDLREGTDFAGRYRIIEEIGRGGMGVVQKAHDTKLKRTVALKFLPPEYTHIPEVKERFMLEAQAAASLDHPNICTVFEFDEAEGQSFISMAYIHGQSLRKRIEANPLEPTESLRIVTQVAEGLNEAHQKGVVHRDIKSANIMVDDRGQAHIMDFGLARISGRAHVTKEGTTMGTIAYMSPEQARGEEVDHRTDIWSLGILLYEILCGQFPFKGEHDQSVIYSILNERTPSARDLNPNIPIELDDVLRKALQKGRDRRYQDMQAFLNDLLSIQKGEAPETAGIPRLKSSFILKKKTVISIGAAVVLIGFIAVLLTLLTGQVSAVKSIAVLPIRDLSGQAGREYLSEGITDALINELAKVSALGVRARQSVMRYRNSDKSLEEIARELKVDAVIEASLSSVGDRIQIRAQLIRAQTEEILWADSFEREMSDILILQSEMAQAIVRKIHIAVTTEEEVRLTDAGKVDPELYEIYLKGQYHAFKLTQQDLDIATQYYQSILDKDPDYALAHTGMAFMYLGHLAQGTAPDPLEAITKAKAAAAKALDLDNTLEEAHATLGIIYELEWNWKEGEKLLRKALSLNPNFAFAHAYYAHILFITGRPQQAVEHMEKSRELDPFNPLLQALYGMGLTFARRYDDAISLLTNNLKDSPNNLVSLSALRTVYHLKGMDEDAIVIWRKSYSAREDHEALAALNSGYSESGYRGALKRVAEVMVERSKSSYVTPWQIGTLYTRAGMRDEALDWLEKAVDEKDANAAYMTVDPIFDDLRDSPRFKSMLRRMNLLDTN